MTECIKITRPSAREVDRLNEDLSRRRIKVEDGREALNAFFESRQELKEQLNQTANPASKKRADRAYPPTAVDVTTARMIAPRNYTVVQAPNRSVLAKIDAILRL